MRSTEEEDMLNRILTPIRPAICWLGLLALTLMAGCGGEAGSIPAPLAAEVGVVEVVQRDVRVYHEGIGAVEGMVNAQIRAQVTGYLLRRTYTEGGYVKQGDLLFEIDSRRFLAAVDQARGDLAKAKAHMGKAELEVKRDRPLAKAGGVSQKELDDSLQAYEAAKAAVLSARAALESAKINLDFTSITAPIDGVIGVARAQIGTLVGPNDELTSMSTLDPIRVYVPISEQEYLQFADRIQHAYEMKFTDPDSPNLELILHAG